MSKYISQEPFIDLNSVVKHFPKNTLNDCVSKLKYRSKKDAIQSFYIGGDGIKIIKKESSKKEYIKLPKMTPIKLTEHIRFSGHILGCRIIKKFNKYYVSIYVDLGEIAKKDTITNERIGVDLGIRNHITLSNGLAFNYPVSILKIKKKIKAIQRTMSKKNHPRTKDDLMTCSNNYIKCKNKIDELYEKMRNIMLDYECKVSKVLTHYYSYVCIEQLNVKAMKKKKPIARQLQAISFYRIRKCLENKSHEYKTEIIVNENYFPSSRICSNCGNIKQELKLEDRIYKCEKCGIVIDRDINAAINLTKKVGRVTSDIKPLDLDELIMIAKKSNINVFKIEEGKQQRIMH